MKQFLLLLILALFYSCETPQKSETATPKIAKTWDSEKSWNWFENQPWYVGTNFNPSSSVNQLEFWQEETFDLETVKRELSWSAEIGMNVHRVYLHNLLWEQDSVGFLNRVDQYLSIADSLTIKTMLVLLDDVWYPVPKLGKQPDPVPHLHNSGWVQSPGAEILGESSRHKELEPYIKGVIKRFSNDPRVVIWDLYNEPDNVTLQEDRAHLEVQNKHIYSLSLLRKVVRWSREVNPSQPLTMGIWRGEVRHWGTPDSLPPIDRFMMENSDVISFHAYDGDMETVKRKIEELKKYKKPMFCTEYIARGFGNTFENVLPILKENRIAAINWGFVSGKTNTIYPWESWGTAFTEEPEIWHHDILRIDGSPYSEAEVKFIADMINE